MKAIKKNSKSIGKFENKTVNNGSAIKGGTEVVNTIRLRVSRYRGTRNE
ncbi:MAG: hypothetical protein GQ574_26345 [Crocinitomix sp.]|nr:hypothetical protein [Crocinitomix sp.]